MQKTLFISDLHLDPAHPASAVPFFKLINSLDQSTDAVYILGDLVESWIGDDDNNAFYAAMKTGLKKLSLQGIKLYFQHGNRDFLMGKRFTRETGCEILPEEHKISLYGTPVLLMHGDTLCTEDVAYLKARKFAYNKLNRFIYLSLPLCLRRKIANHFRGKSMRHTQQVKKEILDVTQSAVESVMLKHKVLYLIHGHTHRPATHTFLLHNQPATRHVLPAWHDGRHVFVWYEDGKKESLDI